MGLIVAPGFLEDVVPRVLYNVRMGVGFQLHQEFHFLPENELIDLIFKSNFLYALDAALLVHHLVHETIPSLSDHPPDVEGLEHFLISADELRLS